MIQIQDLNLIMLVQANQNVKVGKEILTPAVVTRSL